MAREPFLPLFFGDFLSATAEWEGEEQALYLLLLGYQWTLGSIPADPRKICKLVRWDWEAFERFWPAVSEKFAAVDVMATAIGVDGERHGIANGTRLINARLEEHRARASDISSKNSEAGKKGARARWSKKNGSVIADAIPTDGERHESANGAPLWHPIQSNLSKNSLSLACEADAPRGTDKAASVRTSVEAAYGQLLDDWRRDVPEANPDAFQRWIVHCELAGKQMTPGMRIAQAKRLAGMGSHAEQLEVVEWCCEQGYKTLVPLADVRSRRDGRLAGKGARSGKKYVPAPTTEQMEVDMRVGLRDPSGTWLGPRMEDGTPDYSRPEVKAKLQTVAA